MLKKLLGRGSEPAKAKDKAIIHQSVPEEVLFPHGRPEEKADMSWLEDAPIKKAKPEAAVPDVAPSNGTASTAAPSAAKPVWTRPAPKTPKAAPAPEAMAGERPSAGLFESAPNPPAAARPACPVGWLVVVEGPGTGEWFVLEAGLSEIGRGDGQTVKLDFGDEGLSAARHAALAFDGETDAFHVTGEALRVNGVAKNGPVRVRDGDVIGLSATGLKLVALAGPNFRWVL